MFYPSVSSSGMRLVPVTNTQKSSGPRLRYKFFAGAKPARSHKEDLHHVGIIDYGGVRAGMGCLCGHRLGRPEEFLAAAPCRLPAAGAGELDNTPEAVEVWAAGLQQRFRGRRIAVILE